MSWWNFGKKQEKRNNQANELGYGVCGGFSIFKNHNNAALSLSAVYSATELISNSIALLPIEIKYNDEAGKTQRNRQHPLNNTFNNNKLSKYMIVKMMVSDMLLYGNGFAYIQRNQQGEPIGLRYIESRDVNINWDKHKDRLFYTCGLFPNSVIKPEDMLHIYKNSYDGYNGIGILQYAKRAIDLANYTENSSLDYFAKGLNVTGILHAKQPMTKLQAEQAMNSIQGNINSDRAYYKFLPFDIDFQSLTQNASDAQMLETRLFNVSEIARFFNISPVLLQDLSKSSYSSIEAANLQFLTQTLIPYIAIIEREFNRKLVSDSTVFIDLDEREFLRTDMQSTANYYTTLVNAGILTTNECREQLGYNTVEGGDNLRIPYTDINQNTINDDGAAGGSDSDDDSDSDNKKAEEQ